jgi:hypothetical protein
LSKGLRSRAKGRKAPPGCRCSSYKPLEFRREDVLERIRQTKQIRKTVDELARDDVERVELYRCHACGALWQSGWEWGLGPNGCDEYLFQVPPITVEEWQREHYRQPAAMMMYTIAMANRYGGSRPPEREVLCIEGCGRRAIRLSVHCLEHDIAHGRSVGSVPQEPRGRMFPPYRTVGANAAASDSVSPIAHPFGPGPATPTRPRARARRATDQEGAVSPLGPSQASRAALLARLDPVVRALAEGRPPHPAFCFRCNATPRPKVEQGGAPPAGPPFVTLWECGDEVTGVREREGRLEFLQFDIERPEGCEVVGYSSRALLAHLFFDLVADEDWRDESKSMSRLREAAATVGFDRLDEVLAVQKTGDREARRRYTRAL